MALSKTWIAVIIVAVVVILVLAGGAFWWFYWRKQAGPLCSDAWGEGCAYVREKVFDPSIPAPDLELGLSSFDRVQNGPSPRCTPAWYAVRWVNVADGSFGPLSAWMGPVAAGMEQMPCFDPSGGPSDAKWCATDGVPTGKASANLNRPTIATVGAFPADRTIQKGWYLNLHRLVSQRPPAEFPPPDSAGGKTVGFIIPTGRTAPSGRFPDAIFPVSDDDGSTCRASG